jgi:hypothetical protein
MTVEFADIEKKRRAVAVLREQTDASYRQRESVVEEAQRVAGGSKERASDYGPPEFHHMQSGRVWASLLSQHYKIHLADIPPHVVQMMMVAEKTVRECNKRKRDNLVDAVGYVICAEQTP